MLRVVQSMLITVKNVHWTRFNFFRLYFLQNLFFFPFRYYNHLFMNHLSKEASTLISSTHNCEDMAFNFMVSHVINKSPIKVAHSHHFDPGDPYKDVSIDGRKKADDFKSLGRRFKQKQRCFRELTRIFGRVTLKKSIHKLDPLLYKDPISNYRKRYRDLES